MTSIDESRPEIEATATEVVYRNRWMVVREDAIRRADGSAGLYGVVEKVDFAVVAAVEDGAVHLVEQFRYPVGRRFWELPQGTSDDPVIDAVDLAAMELRQETGLVAGSMVHAGRLFQGYGYSTQAFDVFLATGLEQHAMQLDVRGAGSRRAGLPARRRRPDDARRDDHGCRHRRGIRVAAAEGNVVKRAAKAAALRRRAHSMELPWRR